MRESAAISREPEWAWESITPINAPIARLKPARPVPRPMPSRPVTGRIGRSIALPTPWLGRVKAYAREFIPFGWMAIGGFITFSGMHFWAMLRFMDYETKLASYKVDAMYAMESNQQLLSGGRFVLKIVNEKTGVKEWRFMPPKKLPKGVVKK